MSHFYLISRTYEEDHLEKKTFSLANCRENHQNQKQIYSIKCNKGARAYQHLRKSSKSNLYTEKLDKDRWGVVLKSPSVYLRKGTSPSRNFRNSACFSASIEFFFNSSCDFLVIELFFVTGLDFITRRQYLNNCSYFKIFYSIEFYTFWYETFSRHHFNKYPEKIKIKKEKISSAIRG